jgi:hypothetical protein
MKHITELTASDIQQCGIWTYVDPAKPAIKPWPKKGAAPLLSIVRTECVSANGSAHTGFAILTKINLVAPVIFGGDRQIKLYHGSEEPSLPWRTDAYKALGVAADDFFPVAIRMVVTSRHRPLQNKFDGFVYRSLDGGLSAVR